MRKPDPFDNLYESEQQFEELTIAHNFILNLCLMISHFTQINLSAENNQEKNHANFLEQI